MLQFFRLMVDNIETSSKLEKSHETVNNLKKQVSELEIALHENREKTDKLESELLNKFSEILNSKKQKIRQLQTK